MPTNAYDITSADVMQAQLAEQINARMPVQIAQAQELQRAAAPTTLDIAVQKYPYLRGKDIQYVSTRDPTDFRILEFWDKSSKGFTRGDKEYPRPPELALGKVGVQDIKGATPLDILGDYVSHYAVNNDPKLAEMYQAFKTSVPDSVMRDRYNYHVSKLGERRPYKEWLDVTGLSEYFRGYTFNQWKNAKSLYGPEQLRILNQVRDYLQIK
jgi:hypothetical protein